MISIFARPSYVGNRYPEHTKESSLLRVSSRIRGEEMAEYLEAKLNPKEFSGDVCVHVKPVDLDLVSDGDWVDFLDGGEIYKMLKDRPKVKVIASSQNSYDFLKSHLINELVLIPSHHLNIDRLKRPAREIKTGGYIGSPSPVATKIYSEVRNKFKTIGLNFVTCFNYKERQDAVNLYLKTDIFVIADFSKDYNPNKIPTKIINAASFGVPSLAFPLAGYKEIDGYYIKVHNMDELITEAIKLKNKDYYYDWSKRVSVMAENYHISKIADLYRKL